MLKIIINLILISIILLLLKYYMINKETFYDNDQKDWLSNIFDSVYVICIPERLQYVYDFCESFKIRPVLFNAILKDQINYDNAHNLKMGEIACALSHENVLQNFLKTDAKHILIFEDDIMYLSDNFYTNMNINLKFINDYIENAFKSLPDDWDLLYLGRCWDNCSNHIKINDFIVKTKRTLCNHAIVFSRKGAQKIIDNIVHPMSVPIDHLISNLNYNNIINAYATILPLFYQNRLDLTSTIGNFDSLPVCS
jgi:GR25 family glycosyltransferase involved in LPS biosynthesis